MSRELIYRGTDGQESRVTAYTLGKSMTPEFLCRVMESWFNSLSINEKSAGKTFAEELEKSHRTLQGTVINFCLAVLHTYGEMYPTYADPRNETALAACEKIKKMLDTGEIHYQPFI